MNGLKNIYRIALRECGILAHNPIYWFCMLVFPVLVTFFFTSLMGEGEPENMPCGVIDLDQTATTRAMIRRLDAFQTTRVAAYYNNVNEARQAIQRGEIYAFLYIPRGTTAKMQSGRQPDISFYYSSVSMVAGSLTFRDMKTVTSLGAAGIGAAKLSALGKTEKEIEAFLQPTLIDLHMVGNPWGNYNIYLSSVMIPGILMLFIFLITVYSIGNELKFGTSREWLAMAGDNIFVAVIGKLLPQFLVFLSIMYGFLWYTFGHLAFPHPGGVGIIMLLGLLSVLGAQGFGVFMFGLMPSLRMAMSMCSLWAVLGFSLSGATFPVFAMDPMIEAMAWLFPLRHYYMIYQVCIFNGYPLIDVWMNVVVLVAFFMLPCLTLWHLRKAMLEYEYIP